MINNAKLENSYPKMKHRRISSRRVMQSDMYLKNILTDMHNLELEGFRKKLKERRQRGYCDGSSRGLNYNGSWGDGKTDAG